MTTLSKPQPAYSTAQSPKKAPPNTAVCIVVENLPVPLDRRVWREACALRDAGYQVHVISPKGSGAYTASYEHLDGVHIYRHSMWEASSKIGYVLEYLTALAAECYLTFKVFAHSRFRILQACNPPDTIFLIALLLKPFGVRFIFDHHDLSPELYETKFDKKGLFYKLTAILEVCSFRCAKVSIATNESFKEVAVARGKKHPDDVFVVRNCPDLVSLRGKGYSPEAKSQGQFSIAYVGFMGAQDGLPLLIESIDYIVNNQKRVDTRFVLVGDGPELPRLKEMVARLNLNQFVTFTGRVPYERVANYLSTAHVGVAPDPKTPMNDQSTMIKIFEYMAFGLPIVLFDLKEGRRVAGPAALYASPNDPIDFANQILRLLDSETLRDEHGGVGRRRVEQSLNWDNEKVAYLEAFERALQ